MKLVTAAQMRDIDKRAIEQFGIPSLTLMENAGRGIAELIRAQFGENLVQTKFAIVCGKGNNGGDGLVVARYLKRWGAPVSVFLLASRETLSGDARTNLGRAEEVGIAVEQVKGEALAERLEDADILVDAILGTGFSGNNLNDEIGGAITALNRSGVPIIAIDVPSGLNCDTGEVPESCTRAFLTATLGLPKSGMYFYPGKAYCGHIEVIDIGIPDTCVEVSKIDSDVVTSSEADSWIPERRPTDNKGDAGKVSIFAGSVGLTGAAALAAISAVRAGSGLVTVGCPSSLNDILEAKLTEAMTKPLPEVRPKRCLSMRSLGMMMEMAKTSDSVCLGPGIGRHRDTMELVRRFVGSFHGRLILDADGLYAFSAHAELLKLSPAEMVITPHPGEFARLVGKKVSEIEDNRLEAAMALAIEIEKVVLLKGAPTIIATPDGRAYVNPTGNAGMATGGSGDVLAGVITAFLGFGMAAEAAAVCGAYVHGLAGDLARDEWGTFGMTASDIVAKLPAAMLTVKRY